MQTGQNQNNNKNQKEKKGQNEEGKHGNMHLSSTIVAIYVSWLQHNAGSKF